MSRRHSALVGWLLLLAACRSQKTEPAPLPASHELVMAPPGARGARAAGTDGAPPAPNEGPLGAPEVDDPEPDPDPDPDDSGVPADAAGATDAGPGVAL
jgi:hypothetical protein